MLDEAVAAGDNDAVLKLINEEGPDKLGLITNLKGTTALAQAAWYGYKDIVETLSPHVSYIPSWLDQVVQISDTYENSPLGAAAGKGFTEIMTILLDHEADPNAQALNTAAGKGQADAVSLLLDRGAQGSGETVLAATNGLLSNYPESNQPGNEYQKVIEVLIDCGAGLDEQEIDTQEVPIEKAAKAGRLDIVQTLVEHGASINPPNRSALTYSSPLAQMALTKADEGNAIMAYLLERGGSLYTEDEYYNAARAYIDEGRSDLLSMLLESKKVNLDYGFPPPLIYAAEKGCKDAVKLLLDHGADILVGGVFQPTAFDVAVNAGDVGVLTTLMDHNATAILSALQLPISKAASARKYDMVSLLITKYGADVNQINEDDDTALLQLTREEEDNAEAVEFLLAQGADPNIPDPGCSGQSALSNAVNNKHKDIINTLLKHGAKVDQLALEYANEDDDKTILNLLQQHKQQ